MLTTIRTRKPLAVGQIRRHPDHGLIYIIDGDFERNGRISNFWDFRKVLKDGRLSARIYGDYGGSEWPTPKNIVVQIRVVQKKPRASKTP